MIVLCFFAALISSQAQLEMPAITLQEETTPTNAAKITSSKTASPTKNEMWVDEGIKLLKENRGKEASDIFKQVLAKEPKNRRARFSLATAYITMNQYQDSITMLEALVVDYPEDFSIKNNLAWLYATAKDPRFRDPKKSIKLARDALLTAPSSCHVWSTLAEAHYVMGDYDKALRAAEEALRLAQNDPSNQDSKLEYLMQVSRCQTALQAMSLIE